MTYAIPRCPFCGNNHNGPCFSVVHYPPLSAPRNIPHKCPVCNGDGERWDCNGCYTGKVSCRACGGSGVVWGAA